jgi:hypothetical protein
MKRIADIGITRVGQNAIIVDRAPSELEMPLNTKKN